MPTQFLAQFIGPILTGLGLEEVSQNGINENHFSFFVKANGLQIANKKRSHLILQPWGQFAPKNFQALFEKRLAFLSVEMLT
jgi:hypothetical protein